LKPENNTGKPHSLFHFIADPSPFGPIVSALEVIDEAWFAKHPEVDRSETGRVADLWMLGVHPDYRGHGIASELTRLSLERVARAGFEYAVVECTGAFSQRVMEAAGCTAVFELPYADFLWKGEAIFKDVPAPHCKWVIYEKKLN
jgi:GNAT superfamily N-acetyltransferase